MKLERPCCLFPKHRLSHTDEGLELYCYSCGTTRRSPTDLANRRAAVLTRVDIHHGWVGFPGWNMHLLIQRALKQRQERREREAQAELDDR